jgi:glutathione S-transferase
MGVGVPRPGSAPQAPLPEPLRWIAGHAMVEPILHHFAASPFSEKLRLVLGYKALDWRSVTVPMMVPKPDAVALTGGYRRTPFLQMGADVYCDTALVCDVLERLKASPPLYPLATAALTRTVAQWADDSLFWATVRHNRGPQGSGLQFGGPAGQAQALFEDRKAMGFDLDWQRPQDASAPYRCYLQRLADMLEGRAFLLGAQPCMADFCAYHPLWLAHLRSQPARDVLAPWPGVAQWLARMQAIGHGHSRPMDAQQAIALAARSEPRPVGANGLPAGDEVEATGCAIGSPVAVAAQSFGTEPTRGILVAVSRTHCTLRHENTRVGCVHVHFPRIGYVLRQLAPERTDMQTQRPNRAVTHAQDRARGPDRAHQR